MPRCDHDPGCCVYCCPAEPDSNGTGEGCQRLPAGDT